LTLALAASMEEEERTTNDLDGGAINGKHQQSQAQRAWCGRSNRIPILGRGERLI
jgi:hypothetical protein